MLYLLVCLPFLGALVVYPASRYLHIHPSLVSGLTATLGLIIVIHSGLAVYEGDLLLNQQQWMPAIGLSLSFRLDGLGLLFAQLILGIGVLVIFYARYYLTETEAGPRLYAYLLLFMGAMLGLVLACGKSAPDARILGVDQPCILSAHRISPTGY